MSLALEARVWDTRGLAPTHRLVLLAIAREVPEGATEVLVNRTALSERLQCRPDLVRMALGAGADVGLVQVLKGGRIAFAAHDGTLFVDRAAMAPRAAVRPAPVRTGAEEPPAPPRLHPRAIVEEFGRQWAVVYGQRYHPQDRDVKLAKGLVDFEWEEYRRRIARYLRSDEDYYRERTHAFYIFVNDINRFVTRPKAEARPTTTSGAEYVNRQREGR